MGPEKTLDAEDVYRGAVAEKYGEPAFNTGVMNRSIAENRDAFLCSGDLNGKQYRYTVTSVDDKTVTVTVSHALVPDATWYVKLGLVSGKIMSIDCNDTPLIQTDENGGVKITSRKEQE